LRHENFRGPGGCVGDRCDVRRRGLGANPGTIGLAQLNALTQQSVTTNAQAGRSPCTQGARVAPARAARAPSAQANALLDFAPGIRWAVTGTDNATLVRWVFEPPDRASIPDEVHTITQSGIVLEGSFSLLYRDGSRQLLRKQDVYSIPPGVAHGAEFHERTVLFDVYTPNHVEFEARYRRQLLERAEVS
jgi:quercetin dioxygenase-like cupin family protein